ncbi:MAG TPA: MEDS domain-containing protein [Vicinamibacterales bacterium]|nr:MEDS domain-containing protein [Vicinamibacterales bacterium]
MVIMVEGKGHFHAVRFYYDSSGLCDIVTDFVAEGLNAGEPAVVVAMPAHSARIETLLAIRGFDVASLKRSGDLYIKDASATLASLMVNRTLDEARFRRVIGPIVESAAGPRKRTVRVYGEMVDLLWKAGSTDAATHLETLWNGLSSTHVFVLLCAYALDGISHTTHISEICGLHTHVLAANGEVTRAH